MTPVQVVNDIDITVATAEIKYSASIDSDIVQQSSETSM